MSKRVWIGIDVGKQSFWAAVAGPGPGVETWTDLPARAFDHDRAGLDAFVRWVQDQGLEAGAVAGLCLEATGRLATRWAELQGGRVGAVSIVNPACPDAFRKSLGIRETSDRVDACVLALFAKTTRPRPTVRLSPVRAELRELFRSYQTLQADEQAYRLRLGDGPTSAMVRATYKKLIASLRRQLDRLEAAMDQRIAQDPALRAHARRMETIVGVGAKTVRLMLAEFDDLRRYTRNQLVALAGLFPKEHTSGTSVRKKTRLAKGGGGRVRKALFLCALSAKRHNPHMRRFAQRLQARGKKPMEAIGAIMRKLLLLIRALIVSGKDYDPQYA